MICSLWHILVLLICHAAGVKKLSERYSWRTLHFQFDSREDREAAKNGGYFEYGNSIITSIALSGDRLFLATPRLKSGVPSTLNYIRTSGTNRWLEPSELALFDGSVDKKRTSEFNFFFQFLRFWYIHYFQK